MGHTPFGLICGIIKRFIPTYVGHTSVSVSVPVSLSGSSPHTWGIHFTPQGWTVNVRFIPTYVGHTNLTQYDTGNYAVHPHIRGAYGSSPRRRWGSAVHPHIRGAYYQGATVQRTCGRFIPTYVGHTHFRASARALISVHPHIRGAYYLYKLSVSQVLGSSPHTWGILSQGPHIPQILRFIPTYVGHT